MSHFLWIGICLLIINYQGRQLFCRQGHPRDPSFLFSISFVDSETKSSLVSPSAMSSLPIVFDDQHLNMDGDKTRLLIPSVDGMSTAELQFWREFESREYCGNHGTYSSLAPCTSFEPVCTWIIFVIFWIWILSVFLCLLQFFFSLSTFFCSLNYSFISILNVLSIKNWTYKHLQLMNQNWQSDKVVKLVSLESTMKLDSMLVALVVVPLLRAILLKYYKIVHFCMYESANFD